MIDDIKKKLDYCIDYWKRQSDQIKKDLIFNSGHQWNDQVRKKREAKGRPVVVKNMTKAYCDRIVNPLRLSPIQIKLSISDEITETVLNGVIRGIERDSGGSEYAAHALESAVISGMGFIKVAVEKEYGSKGANVIRIKRVPDLTKIYYDPYSIELDGSDAQYAFETSFISKEEAEKYGDDALKPITVNPQFVPPQGSVLELIHHELFDDDDNEGAKSLRITRWVGSHKAEEVVYQAHALDIIPVYGERVWEDDNGLYWGGMVRRLRDPQAEVNLYASNAMDLAAKATKSPYIIPRGSVKGFEAQWNASNTEDFAYLEFNTVDDNNNPVAPPQRADNTAQTSWLQSLQDQSAGSFGRVSGISDMMMAGGAKTAQEAAQTVSMRLGAAEIATAHFVDHLASSLKQVGRVICDLLPVVYIGERNITVVDSVGRSSRVIEDLSARITPDVRDILHVDVDGGPSLENRKREAVMALRDALTLNPEAVPKVFTKYIDLLDLPNGREIIRAIDGEQGEEGDPQALAALQAAEQTIGQQQQALDYLQGMVGQLQQQVLSSQQDNETKLMVEKIRSETQLMLESIRSENKMQLEAIKGLFDRFKVEEKEEVEAAPKVPISIGGILSETGD